jgi:hypothetical protein
MRILLPHRAVWDGVSDIRNVRPSCQDVHEGRMLVDDITLEGVRNILASFTEAARYVETGANPILVGSELRPLLPVVSKTITGEHDFG